MKDEESYRVKLRLGRFLEVVKNDIIEKWQRDRDTTKTISKTFIEKPEITHYGSKVFLLISMIGQQRQFRKKCKFMSTFMSTGCVNGNAKACFS